MARALLRYQMLQNYFKCNGNYPIYGASGFINNLDFYKQDNLYVSVVKDGAGIGRVMQLTAFSSVTGIGKMQYIIPSAVDHIEQYWMAGKLFLKTPD